MGLYTKLPEAIDEVDVIIAGGQYYACPQKTSQISHNIGIDLGGTAGCVVASRLADADPELSILVIEGGPNNDIPTVEIPANFLAHLSPESKTNRFHLTKKSTEVADRSLIVPTGNILGGGSSTNFMMYSRAQRSDWDSWNTPGWSADEMLPFLKKVSLLFKLRAACGTPQADSRSCSWRRIMATMRRESTDTRGQFIYPVEHTTPPGSRTTS